MRVPQNLKKDVYKTNMDKLNQFTLQFYILVILNYYSENCGHI